MYCEPSWKNASSVTFMIRLVGSTISIPATRVRLQRRGLRVVRHAGLERAGAVDVVGLRPGTLRVEAGRVARSGNVERRFSVDLRLARLHVLLGLVALDRFDRAFLGLLLLLDLLGLLLSLLLDLLLLHGLLLLLLRLLGRRLRLFLLLLRLRLGDRRLLVVVIVIATADERETRCTDTGARACSQQGPA